MYLDGVEGFLAQTTLFSQEEKDAIHALFALDELGTSITGYDSVQFFVHNYGLIGLRLNCTDESEVELWTSYSYYIKAVAEDWYAHIIISRPM